MKVEKEDEGLDFFFKTKSNASKLVDFIKNLVPCKIKNSSKLISVDE